MLKRLAAEAALCALLLNCAPVQALQMAPRDEATKDKSLVAFRVRLLQAIKQRDAQYVQSILAPNVEYALGGGFGKADFESQWQFKSKKSDAWNVLERCLQRGGYFENDEKGRQFVAPYAAFDDVTDSGLEMALIASADEPLREKPATDSATVAKLHYDFVELPDDVKGTPASWTAVKFGKKHGFVRSANLIKQTDPFVTFKKIHGKWTLTWFGSAST